MNLQSCQNYAQLDSEGRRNQKTRKSKQRRGGGRQADTGLGMGIAVHQTSKKKMENSFFIIAYSESLTSWL